MSENPYMLGRTFVASEFLIVIHRNVTAQFPILDSWTAQCAFWTAQIGWTACFEYGLIYTLLLLLLLLLHTAVFARKNTASY